MGGRDLLAGALSFVLTLFVLSPSRRLALAPRLLGVEIKTNGLVHVLLPDACHLRVLYE